MKQTTLVIALLLGALVLQAQDDKKGIEKILGEKSLPTVELSDMHSNKVNVADLGKTGHPVNYRSGWNIQVCMEQAP